MRSNEIVRAKNYIKKHERRKRWIAFALCLSLLTGTLTLYGLNKPATAMTAEGAKSVGLVLETADSEFEAGLIEQTQENKAENENNDVTEAEDNAASGSGVEDQKGEDNSSDEAGLGSDTDDSEDGKESSAVAGTSDEEEEEAADEASSEEASDEASKESSTEVKEDVVITVLYVDGEGEEIAESKELNISECFNVKEDTRSFEGYIFDKAVIDETEVVKVTKESDKETERAYYLADTANGEELEITEDAELKLIYNKVNDVDEFVYDQDGIKVTVKLSDPTILPAGVELSVKALEKDSEEYNYLAYIDALNESAEEIARANGEDTQTEYDETNTYLFDIAFVLDGIEYEPKDGTVSVSIEFTDNQISDGLDAKKAEDISIVHLPLTEEKMQEVASTSEATDITSADINVEIMENSSIEIGDGGDIVTFETTSFSVYGAIKSSSEHSWVGNQAYSAREIVEWLGDSTLFGVVAERYNGHTNHSEANIAVGKIENIQNYTIGISTRVYTELTEYKVKVNKVVHGSPKVGTFYFALFSDSEGKKKIGGSEFSITTGADGTGSHIIDFADLSKKYPGLYVFELDGEGGTAVMEGGTVGKYKVAYGTDYIAGVTDVARFFNDNYIVDMNGNDVVDALEKVDGATIYTPTGWNSYMGITYHEQQVYGKKPNGEYGLTNYTREDYEGRMPVDHTAMLNDAKITSSKLAYAVSTGDVEVVNLVGTKENGSLMTDLSKYYFNVSSDPNDYAVNTGFSLPDNKLLLINVDLTDATNYTLSKIKYNTKGTGDWSQAANHIILNLVKRDANGDFIPFDGELTADTMSGTLIAPEATVHVTSSYSGTILADYVDKVCEIHKMDVRRYLDEQATVDIVNEGSTIYPFEIEARKLVDGDTPEHDEIFSFTLKYYNEKTKSWDTISDNIRNDGDRITYKFDDPTIYGMEYGEGNTYYFLLTENDTTSAYHKDDSGIGIKVKYYPKTVAGIVTDSINEISYYRIKNSHVRNLLKKFDAKWFADPITNAADVFFNNIKKGPFDIQLYKYLDGQLLPDSSDLKFNFWVRLLYKDENGIGVEKGTNGSTQTRYRSANSVQNIGGSIRYTVDPDLWELEKGKTYYYLFIEGNAEEGNTVSTSLDKTLFVIKVDYYVDGVTIQKGYYKISDSAEISEVNKVHLNALNYCDASHEVTGEEAAFNNKTLIKLSLVKHWDDLADDSFSEDWTTDNIWDVTAVVKRRVEGGQYKEVKRYVITSSDYPEAGHSKEVVFDNLRAYDDDGNKYEYAVDEYYNGTQLLPLASKVYNAKGELVSEAYLRENSVETVNGYKLTEYDTSYDERGNISVELTNTPYLIIRKIWTKNDQEIPYAETEGYGSVFVNLYRSYQDGPMTLYQKAIMLSYGNEWTVEIPVSRKYTYSIVECDSTGNIEYEESSLIVYYSYNDSNVTKPDDYRHDHGFTDYTQSSTNWKQVYVQGDNYPFIMLAVQNDRGDNVLPSAGGMGTIPLLALGTLLIAIAAAGMLIFRKRDT
ncbi:hypothetical protein [Butyrivibrio sp. FCS014]|uniref:hypothetical protein n=1 Tax=Butyrivibrio sp. FCS014 TaxID=1408304 RepID=UPI0004665A8B|nr:hypothetical protein [Butyrivibrio sp. FCS014]